MAPSDSFNEKLHVVLVPLYAQGHIPPMIQLAMKLAARGGFIVTILNIDGIHRELLRGWSCPPGLDIRLQEVSCALGLSTSGIDADSLRKHDQVDYHEMSELLGFGVEKLLGKMQPIPCCLIADVFYGWPAKVAKMHNMMPVTYFPGNAAWASLHHHLDLLISSGDVYAEGGASDVTEDRVISYVPGIEELKFEDFPEYYRVATEKRRAFFHACKNRMRDSEWNLVNSMVELEPGTFQVMQADLGHFVSIGPLFPLTGNCLKSNNGSLGSLREEDLNCLSWLDSHPPHSILYISLGSLASLTEESFEEFAAGLEASKQPFLWVIRSDLLVKTATSERKFEEFVARTREQGAVVSWAPQLRVLEHSAVGGFITHCGWNSTFESLCNGVPLLCWPMIAEQRLNCKMVVEDWKFGMCFSKVPLVERREVEEKVGDFMRETGKIRSRMRDLVGKAHASVERGGVSYENLNEFIHAVRSM